MICGFYFLLYASSLARVKESFKKTTNGAAGTGGGFSGKLKKKIRVTTSWYWYYMQRFGIYTYDMYRT